MRLIKLVILATLVGASLSAAAQVPPGYVVRGQALLSHDKLRQGTTFEIAVVLNILPEYHIYSSDKKSPFPTELKTSPVNGITFGRAIWPKPKKLELAGEKMDGYEGEVVIRVPATVAKAAKPGPRSFVMKIGFLPCSEKSCLAPTELTLKANAPVTSGSAKAKRINQKYFPSVRASSDPAGGARTNLGAVGGIIDRWGTAAGFVAVFFMGVALAFFPCVYPLIPVTVAFFAAQRSNQRPLGLCVVYVLGIAITYSTIGGTAAAVGGMLGSALQYPAVLWSVACIIVLLALSMFGLFQLRVPSFISDRAAGRSGLLGALAMGLLMGVVAAPCGAGVVAPVISLAAASGSVPFGIAIFFVFSLGLGLPYMILGMSSHALARAPSAGPWMVTIERLFGFALIGIALYVVSPLLAPLAVRIAYAVVVAAAGVYLCASSKPTPTKRPLRLAAGLAVVLVGIGLAPWRGDSEGDPNVRITWIEYSPDVLRQASVEGKPVTMDFGAEWCYYCKKLDRTTFRDPRVVRESRSFAMVRVDLTRSQDPRAAEMRRKFRIVGLPTVVFLDRAGNEITGLRITDYVGPDEMLRRMKAANR